MAGCMRDDTLRCFPPAAAAAAASISSLNLSGVSPGTPRTPRTENDVDSSGVAAKVLPI
jgi:hypothetical protein